MPGETTLNENSGVTSRDYNSFPGGHQEKIMNIFYIIGVIVVVIFVAGFFGVHGI
jgi:hypothetical protein